MGEATEQSKGETAQPQRWWVDYLYNVQSGRLVDTMIGKAVVSNSERRGEGVADNIRGELWVFLRDLLAQGGHIRDDYHGKTYESYAARLDAAARERTNELEQMLATRGHK